MMDPGDEASPGVRLDKWLWAARFFKTRALAHEAIKGGKVEVNGQKPKPARAVRIADELRIQRGLFQYRVTVLQIGHQRLAAIHAATLYRETDDSIARREQLALELKTQAAIHPLSPGRPGKRDRRRIIRFT
ncbi:MAG: RNA-binding S4 domain-containing protein, partial [Gammaproteobacteria bacterium]